MDADKEKQPTAASLLRKRRINEGLCSRCGGIKEPWRTSLECEFCRAKQSMIRKRRTESRAAKGLCTTCGSPLPENYIKLGKKCCETCSAISRYGRRVDKKLFKEFLIWRKDHYGT